MGENVTLRPDESIIRRARHAAVEQDQSLSEWVSGFSDKRGFLIKGMLDKT